MNWTLRITFLALAAAGCTHEVELVERTGSDTWQQAATDQVDILWVIDDSASMEEEQALLRDNFAAFADSLEESGTDFQLGVTTTGFSLDDDARGRLLGEPAVITAEDRHYASMFAQRVEVGLEGDGMERGFQAAEHALSAVMATSWNEGFLRDTAHLVMLFVTDEDDCSDEGRLGSDDPRDCYLEPEALTPVWEYADRFSALKTDDTLSVSAGAIVASSDETLCDSAMPGTRYADLADQMGGFVGDLCGNDWASMLTDLGLEAAGMITSFPISELPEVDSLVVWIDDIVVPESDTDGYSWNEETQSIEFHGGWVPPRGSTVRADYSLRPLSAL